MSDRNVGASVYARLKNISRERGLDMVGLLRRYAQERLLYRLSVSDEAGNFCVKGGILLSAYNDGNLLRPTEDIDFNGFERDASIATLKRALEVVLSIPVADDGVVFLPDSMKIEKDRTGIIPGGKVALQAKVHTAKVDLKVDVGFGNPVMPEVRHIVMPTILEGFVPRPLVLAYPLETVIAEKVHAMAQFGFDNTRLKDYFDVWMLQGLHSFDGNQLVEAVTETFEVQGRRVPEAPFEGLTEDFADYAEDRWAAFLRRIDDRSGAELRHVVAELAAFVHPVTEAARRGDHMDGTWEPSSGWSGPALGLSPG